MKKIISILITCAVIGIAGYLAYNWMTDGARRSADTLLKQEAETQQRTIAELKEKVSTLQEKLDEKEETAISKEKIARTFGDRAAEVPLPEVKKLSCEELNQRVSSFFKYLDDKKYIQPCALSDSSEELFKKMVTHLAENTPEITGETQEVPVLMKNMAYFYRVLGRKRLACVRDIISQEADIIESIMTTFYQYYLSNKGCQGIALSLPSLETSYTYAAFFLNTLAGKNYLLRRSSKIRILTTYYCTLIIDRANEKQLNRYGFDIRPQIEMLMGDIADQKRLVYKEHYLEELKSLHNKYF